MYNMEDLFFYKFCRSDVCYTCGARAFLTSKERFMTYIFIQL